MDLGGLQHVGEATGVLQNGQLTLDRFDQARHRVQERRLAGSVGADDGGDRPCRNLETRRPEGEVVGVGQLHPPPDHRRRFHRHVLHTPWSSSRCPSTRNPDSAPAAEPNRPIEASRSSGSGTSSVEPHTLQVR